MEKLIKKDFLRPSEWSVETISTGGLLSVGKLGIQLKINFKSVSFLRFSFHPLSEVPREAWLDHLSWIRSLLQSVTENEEEGEDVR